MMSLGRPYGRIGDVSCCGMLGRAFTLNQRPWLNYWIVRVWTREKEHKQLRRHTVRHGKSQTSKPMHTDGKHAWHPKNDDSEEEKQFDRTHMSKKRIDAPTTRRQTSAQWRTVKSAHRHTLTERKRVRSICCIFWFATAASRVSSTPLIRAYRSKCSSTFVVPHRVVHTATAFVIVSTTKGHTRV